ncbi:alpha beta hydrolase fold family [Grosmannia clavigera kw1407]|uniref:Alpha beta hydrolase fold family n=1 Tax=Grosmannia clavigera (strain kw1407 / UAMH 11150) TaxID=655863 RepID=F0XE61_GROCL|nr:alpha beta hydrolase fold family [Grosmannia clavigera kw1407]EFX04779.1 alpha beta hydrolase fold family [Grosmannia clavigera kw1407]
MATNQQLSTTTTTTITVEGELPGAVPSSRLLLRLEAALFRSLAYVGACLHFLASPQPPAPTFTRTVKSTLSSHTGTFTLHVYTPAGYDDADSDTLYPAVVNFHGGGFSMGLATDDARFARVVVETCGAVFVSVAYRLAPEYPFPTAVDDGADALLYMIRNAAALHIDPQRLATSGFSAGGNIALTSLLRLGAYLHDEPTTTTMETSLAEPVPSHRFVATATWYPVTEYTKTRAARRVASRRPEKTMPPFMTNLFDNSYVFPPTIDRSDPLLSPSQASDARLARDMPPHIVFYTCEWDLLQAEGEALANRLRDPPLSRDVHYKMIPKMLHGWDKSPNPRELPVGAGALYLECCGVLKDAFNVAANAVTGQDLETDT